MESIHSVYGVPALLLYCMVPDMDAVRCACCLFIATLFVYLAVAAVFKKIATKVQLVEISFAGVCPINLGSWSLGLRCSS